MGDVARLTVNMSDGHRWKFKEALEQAKTAVEAQRHDLSEYHVVSIGMDPWISDAIEMGDLFVVHLHYRHDHVHILRGPTREEVLDNISSCSQKDSHQVFFWP